MTARLVSLLGILLVTSLGSGVSSGSKAPFEDIVKQMVDTMDALTTTLATIRDEDTAKGAQPELRKAAAKWQVIKKKAESLPPPSREEKDRVAKEYKVKLEEAQKKLFGEVGRVATVPGGREALRELSAVLDKKTKQAGP